MTFLYMIVFSCDNPLFQRAYSKTIYQRTPYPAFLHYFSRQFPPFLLQRPHMFKVRELLCNFYVVSELNILKSRLVTHGLIYYPIFFILRSAQNILNTKLKCRIRGLSIWWGLQMKCVSCQISYLSMQVESVGLCNNSVSE